MELIIGHRLQLLDMENSEKYEIFEYKGVQPVKYWDDEIKNFHQFNNIQDDDWTIHIEKIEDIWNYDPLKVDGSFFEEYNKLDESCYKWNTKKFKNVILIPVKNIISGRKNLNTKRLLDISKAVFLPPIHIDKNYNIIDGNHRLRFCKENKYEYIPCIIE